MGDYTVPCANTQLWLRVFGGLNNVNNMASQPHLHLRNLTSTQNTDRHKPAYTLPRVSHL